MNRSFYEYQVYELGRFKKLVRTPYQNYLHINPRGAAFTVTKKFHKTWFN